MENRKYLRWHYKNYMEGGTEEQKDNGEGGLFITRLAPGDRCVTLEWKPFQKAAESFNTQYTIEYRLRGNETEKCSLPLREEESTVTILGLENHQDYELWLSAKQVGGAEDAVKSPVRLFRSGPVPGIVVNYIHPEDYTYDFSGRSPASPSIAKLPDGRLVASHDVFWGKGGQNLTKIFRSDDEGESWTFLTDLYPCFWGKLFVHREVLYMIATSTEYGALLIGRSKDGGETWSAPTVILEEGSRESGGPHKAPMPVVVHHGRIWTAIDYGSWQLGGHGSGAVSAPEDSDLLDPSNWTATPFLPYSSQWHGTIQGGTKPGLLEGNIVVTPEKKLVNFLRYNTEGGIPDYGKAIMLEVNMENPASPLQFHKVVDFEGNMTKFTIHYDEVTRRYWSLVNRVTTSNVRQRNILTLVTSKDLIRWENVKDILNYQNNGWPEDSTKVGFQYVDWMVDGDDILVLSRTAINGAYNYHNANHITFHRIEDFRELVYQALEGKTPQS